MGQRSIPFRLVDRLGRETLGIFEHVGELWSLLVQAIVWILRSLVDRKVRVGQSAIIAQIVRIGVQSILIVALVSGAIGFILGFQMAPPLAELGQVERVPNIIAVAVLRELGP
ncbi:MAG: ABC transporter permease, partial [Planctomycetota bacterium]